MTDFILGGILLGISTYIILKLLEDVLPVLVEVEPGQTRKTPRSSSWSKAGTRSRRSRTRSIAPGTPHRSVSHGSGRFMACRTAHGKEDTNKNAPERWHAYRSREVISR